ETFLSSTTKGLFCKPSLTRTILPLQDDLKVVVQAKFAKTEVVCYMFGSTVSKEARAMVLHGAEYCFISLLLAVKFKTRDWIHVIIGIES
ncbi:unnamed protein product, partial [Brassica napus]